MGKVPTTWLLAAAVLLAGMGLILVVWPVGHTTQSGGSGDQPGAGESVTRSEPTPSPSREHPKADEPNDVGHDEPPKAQYRVVDRFAKVFASSTPQPRWLRQLRPLVSHELLAGFRHTDAHRRPVAGRVKKVTAVAEASGAFIVTYADGQRILVKLTESDPWRVVGVEPVKEADPSGTDA